MDTDIKHSKKRGGARPGAGRPSLLDKKRVNVNYSISPKAKSLLPKLKENGIVIGKEIDALVHRLAIEHGLIEEEPPTSSRNSCPSQPSTASSSKGATLPLLANDQ